jgi:tetratricopeptide (TPR) repeat protein
MSSFPKTQAKLKGRIESYKKAFQKEKRTYGAIDDGSGRRFLMGPMYLLMGDHEGALKSYKWYQKEFPDDSDEPFNTLCWTLALFKNGDYEAAKKKLIRTMFSNLYLIPFILDTGEDDPGIRHFSSREEREYVQYLPPELKALWDADSIDWLKNLYCGEEMQIIKEQYISMKRKLNSLKAGEERSRAIDLIHKYKEQFR